jgi:hypothetical protein
VTRFLPHCNGRRGEVWVGEVSNGSSDRSWKAVILPVNGGAACWAKMKDQRVAAFGCSRPRRSLTGDVDLLAAKTRLIASHGTGSALARKAVAH